MDVDCVKEIPGSKDTTEWLPFWVIEIAPEIGPHRPAGFNPNQDLFLYI